MLSKGLMGSRILQIWSNLEKRNQDESTCAHPWMRERQMVRFHANVVIEQNVNVEMTWTESHGGHSPALLLNTLAKRQ